MKYDNIYSEIGHWGGLTAEAAERTAAKWSLVLLHTPKSEHSIMIGGYDEDPRQLWEIPEVCDYMRRFASIVCAVTRRPITKWNLDHSSLAMMALCCGVGKVLSQDESGGATVSIDDEAAFITK